MNLRRTNSDTCEDMSNLAADLQEEAELGERKGRKEMANKTGGLSFLVKQWLMSLVAWQTLDPVLVEHLSILRAWFSQVEWLCCLLCSRHFLGFFFLILFFSSLSGALIPSDVQEHNASVAVFHTHIFPFLPSCSSFFHFHLFSWSTWQH